MTTCKAAGSVAPERISEIHPGVTAAAAREALDFTDYVDSYTDAQIRQAAC